MLKYQRDKKVILNMHKPLFLSVQDFLSQGQLIADYIVHAYCNSFGLDIRDLWVVIQ